MKQPVLIPIRSRGHVSLIRLAASLNIDTQDRQDKQDEKLVHKKLSLLQNSLGSGIYCREELLSLGNPWLARCRSLSRALFCRSILPPSHARLRILQKAQLIGSIFECALMENLSVLRGTSRISFESFPTPWSPFADSSFALLTDPLSPLVEIFFPFPTFGGSLLSFLQPLRGPSSSFVALRGFLFLAFVDNPQLFQTSD